LDEQQSKQSPKIFNYQDGLDTAWNIMFEGFVLYKAVHGTLPKRGTIHCGKDLGVWVFNQRRSYKNAQEGKPGAMSADRIAKLNNVGFDFGVLSGAAHLSDEQLTKHERLEKVWNSMLEGCVAYKTKHGTFAVPQGFVHNGKKLGAWVNTQRTAYKNALDGGGPRAMSVARLAKLKEVGFEFGVRRGDMNQVWDNMLAGLATLYDQHKHFCLPRDYVHNGKNLHNWLATQKTRYRNSTSGAGQCISQNRIEKMKAIGFSFEGNESQVNSTDCGNYDEAILDCSGQHDELKESLLSDGDDENYINLAHKESAPQNSTEIVCCYHRRLRNLSYDKRPRNRLWYLGQQKRQHISWSFCLMAARLIFAYRRCLVRPNVRMNTPQQNETVVSLVTTNFRTWQ
jgi:hypothetical protein